MSMYLLVPPVAFTLILIVVWALSTASGTLGFKRKGPRGALDKPYAGGEDVSKHRFQIDYGQFFPFAFFFTIMHVAVLTIATVPAGAYAFRAFGYLVIIAASISILYSGID